MKKLTDDELAVKIGAHSNVIRAIIDVMAQHSDKALHGGLDYDWERGVLESSINRLCYIVGVETPEERK